MIFPNVPCVIVPTMGNNEFGQPVFGNRTASLCSVIKLATSLKRTSIRTDRSASQGNAKEIVSDSRLLFAATTRLSVGDIIYVGGLKLIAEVIQQRFDVLTGNLDHLQVDLMIWV